MAQGTAGSWEASLEALQEDKSGKSHFLMEFGPVKGVGNGKGREWVEETGIQDW